MTPSAALPALAACCALLALAAAAEPVPWEQRGVTPVANQGSGFLIQYYAGAMSALLERGVVKPGQTPMAGLSGGAFTAVATTLGLTAQQQFDAWTRAVRMCHEQYGDQGGCIGNLNKVVRQAILDGFGADTFQLVNGKVRIGLSQLDATKPSLDNSATWVVSSWNSTQDLVDALTATVMIPCFSDTTAFSIFRNQPVVDGAFAVGFEDLCPGGNTANCIKVASWVTAPLADQTCEHEVCGASCASAGRPLSGKVHQLYDNPADRSSWAINAVNSCQGVQPVLPMGAFVPQNSTLPDIYPGKYNNLPMWKGKQVIACQWQQWAMQPPVTSDAELAEFFQLTFDQGRRDALSWCEEQGMTEAMTAEQRKAVS